MDLAEFGKNATQIIFERKIKKKQKDRRCVVSNKIIFDSPEAGNIDLGLRRTLDKLLKRKQLGITLGTVTRF